MLFTTQAADIKLSIPCGPGRSLNAGPSSIRPTRFTELSLSARSGETTACLAITLDEENTSGIVAWLFDDHGPECLTAAGDTNVLILRKRKSDMTWENLLDVTLCTPDQPSARGVTVVLDVEHTTRLRTYLQSRI